MRANRRPCENVEVTEADENGIAHSFMARVDFDPQTGTPMGVFFATRGREGQLIERLLYRMGVAVSRVMQHR